METEAQVNSQVAQQPATAATAVSEVMEVEQAVVEEVDSLIPIVEEEGAVVDLEVRAGFKVRSTPLSAFSAKTRHWIEWLGERSLGGLHS